MPKEAEQPKQNFKKDRVQAVDDAPETFLQEILKYHQAAENFRRTHSLRERGNIYENPDTEVSSGLADVEAEWKSQHDNKDASWVSSSGLAGIACDGVSSADKSGNVAKITVRYFAPTLEALGGKSFNTVEEAHKHCEYAMYDTFLAVRQQMSDEMKVDPEKYKGGATTIIGACIVYVNGQPHVMRAKAGDSRCFHFQPDKAVPAYKADHARGNAVTRSIYPVENRDKKDWWPIDVTLDPVNPGDFLLLATDGAYEIAKMKAWSERDMQNVIEDLIFNRPEPKATKALIRLFDAMLERCYGLDDFTAVGMVVPPNPERRGSRVQTFQEPVPGDEQPQRRGRKSWFTRIFGR